nr:uncharacterized protein LOC105860680 [Microcebus murinus]
MVAGGAGARAAGRFLLRRPRSGAPIRPCASEAGQAFPAPGLQVTRPPIPQAARASCCFSGAGANSRRDVGRVRAPTPSPAARAPPSPNFTGDVSGGHRRERGGPSPRPQARILPRRPRRGSGAGRARGRETAARSFCLPPPAPKFGKVFLLGKPLSRLPAGRCRIGQTRRIPLWAESSRSRQTSRWWSGGEEVLGTGYVCREIEKSPWESMPLTPGFLHVVANDRMSCFLQDGALPVSEFYSSMCSWHLT